MDGPGGGPGLGRNLSEQLGSGGLEGFAEFGPEHLAQGGAGDQKLRMRGEPCAGFRMDAAAGDQIMDVDVIAHVTLPGMQCSHHADLPAQPPGVERQGLQCLGGGPEEETVDELLMGAGQLPCEDALHAHRHILAIGGQLF